MAMGEVMKLFSALVFCSVILLSHQLELKQDASKLTQYTPDWKSLDSRPIPKWYRDAKFGIFMHWSVFSVTGIGRPDFELLLERGDNRALSYMKENYAPGTTYSDLCKFFTAKYFNATKWVDLFENAGARYVVLISKHLEGFCNWDTKYSERWNSVQCGPGRDLLKELHDAVRNSGVMKFGVYHGMMDVLNSIFKNDQRNHFHTNDFVKRKTTPQLHEIINNYQPDLLWSDADYDAPWEYWNSTEFLAWLYNDSPVKDTVVVNDRWGIGTHCQHGGYMTCKDNYNPQVLQPKHFECCTRAGNTWGYSKHDDIQDIMTPTQVITKLIQVVSCGGNLLLNIAPTFDGFIMPVFQHLLAEIGSFMSTNGEAIYGSTPWTVQNDTSSPNVWYTQQENDGVPVVYACITDHWPGVILELSAPVATNSTRVQLLGYPETLKWSYGQTMKILMPNLAPDSQLRHGWVVKLEMLSIQSQSKMEDNE